MRKNNTYFLPLILSIMLTTSVQAVENNSEIKTQVKNEEKAQNKADDFKIFGQIQSRSEIDARDFNNNSQPLFFTSLRTSLGIEKTFFDNYKLFAQIRDSRVFGESPTTLSNFKNLDLHQGYLSINNIFDKPLSLKLGRFEMSYGTQRFFGAVDWHYVARSFDGFKLSYSSKPPVNIDKNQDINIGSKVLSDLDADFFVLFPNSSNPYIGNALPKTYQDIFYSLNENKELNQVNHEIYGLHLKTIFNPYADFSFLVWLDDYKNTKRTQVDINSQKVWKSLLTDKKQITTALTHKGTYGQFSSIIEGAFQFGKQDDKDINDYSQNKSNPISSYLLSGQIFFNPLNEFKIGLGADLISGDTNGKPYHAFETSYGTNHLYYGFMDYFINVSKDTKYRGLNDFYLTGEWKKQDFPFSVGLNLHHMMSNQPFKNLNTFGQEADLTLKYKVMEKTNLSLGLSAFMPGDIFKDNEFFGKNLNGVAYWTYFMISSGF